MRSDTGGNIFNSLLCLLFIVGATLSCSQFRKMTHKSTLSDKTRELYYNVPAGLEFADTDPGYRVGSSFLMILPNSSEIILQNPDSQPIDLAELGTRLDEFGSRVSPDRREVFIAAAVDISADAFMTVVKEVRRHDIPHAWLLVSGRKTVDDGDWRDGDDIPFPERGFPIELFARNASTKGNFRPDPLTLVVKLVNGKPTMNNEPYNDLDQLTRKLREIFKDREANGVFREGTNEVEKTVNVQVDAAGTGSGTGQRYGDIVSLIDAVKGGGSNSIIIIDAAALRMEPVSPLVLRNGLEEPPPPPMPLPRTGAIPKTISGGVINGKAISLPKPLYPAAAKAVKASGAVNVQVLVDTSGNVISATAVSGHPLLRSAAVQAARSAKFAPTMLSGQPVSVNGVLTYNFVPE